MADDEFEMAVGIPLDADGFYRRECPTCSRELKWYGRGEDETPAPPGGYYCPYCAVQSDAGDYLTQEQADHIEAIINREVIGPEIEKLRDSAKRASGGFVKVDVEYDEPEEPQELSEEPDDMRRVDFACHPDAPVKVLDEWSDAIHCPVCGEPAVTG